MRGRVMTGNGKDNEPWYVAADGTQWSALDVTFYADPIPQTTPAVSNGLAGRNEVGAAKPGKEERES